jgi:hypothetical protein
VDEELLLFVLLSANVIVVALHQRFRLGFHAEPPAENTGSHVGPVPTSQFFCSNSSAGGHRPYSTGKQVVR